MVDYAIRARGLGKKYLIGQRTRPSISIREEVSRRAREIVEKAKGTLKGVSDNETTSLKEYWAIRNVEFEVPHGDVVGVIGRNGAGKSTLLKILSRITDPTEGTATIKGRLSSLLEVGTGFHPELTGRENIFLNGAILGMTRAEIDRKFDEIVSFAGIENFLDTPVKRYSSGMYVRLAFSVAAHLEPEILIVDEVLAVGDAEFQRKSIGKMNDIAKTGRTVLFVSHNMSAIKNLCNNAIFMSDGKIISTGQVHDVISEYENNILKTLDSDLRLRRDRGGNGAIRLLEIKINKIQDHKREDFAPPEIEFRLGMTGRPAKIRIAIYTRDGVLIGDAEMLSASGAYRVGSNHYNAVCNIKDMNLIPDKYYVNITLLDGPDLADHLQQAAVFEIDDYRVADVMASASTRGFLKFNCKWTLE